MGLLGLWTINKELQEVLILNKGNESIVIDHTSVQYNVDFLIFKKNITLNSNKIKRLELITLGTDKFSQSANMFSQMQYGMIIIEQSRNRRIILGQTLNKHELESIFAEIEKCIKPLS